MTCTMVMREPSSVLSLLAGILLAGILVATPFSALAQQQQQQSPLNNNTISSSPQTTEGGGSNATTATSSATTDNETGIGEPLPSPTQTNATTLRGEVGSIQAAHRGEFSWSTAGQWVIQLDGPLVGRPDPQIESFNATIQMVRLDGNILHEHEIYDFNQTSVEQIGDDMTTFNGTMTVTLREGPIENVPGYIQILGDSIAIFVDPRAVDEHFGPTPIRGIVLPEEEEEETLEPL
jgi:hypothetical protein